MRLLQRASCLALALFLAAPADARGCPDTRATQVPERTVESGPRQPCGLSIVLFGLRIVQIGGTCRATRYLYPPHQECLGDVLRGAMCVFEGSLPVVRQSCACGEAPEGGGTPACHCTDVANAGTIEDFQTAMCPTLP